MIITNSKLYDSLKFFALIALPALITFYLGLAALWNWENSDKIAGSMTLVSALLGTLLQISNKQYGKDPANFDGFISSNQLDPDTGLPRLQLTVTKHPEEILDGKVARLKVGSPPGQHRAG